MTDGDKGIQGKASIHKTLETNDCQEVTGRAATDQEQAGQHDRGKTKGLRMRRKLPKLGSSRGTVRVCVRNKMMTAQVVLEKP